MNHARTLRTFAALLALGLALHSQSALACAACYGKTDSALALGMNYGIFCLLAVVVCVLSGIATFFVYIAKKSAITSATVAPGELPDTTQKN